MKTQKALIGKLRLTSSLVVKTGLHIGGGGENLDIGGIDKAVIRDPLTRHPYLPGSSIKGKLRALLERYLQEPLNRVSHTGGVSLYRHECDDINEWQMSMGSNQFKTHVGATECPVCRLFGSTGNPKTLRGSDSSNIVKGENCPASIIVRDAILSSDSAKQLEKIDTGLYMTEWKFENGLDRITAAANPRQLERVPSGAKFDFEIIYNIENISHAQDDVKNIVLALALLQDDALGGHGSRGYGKVLFEELKFFRRIPSDYFIRPQDYDIPFAKFDDLQDLLQRFASVSSGVQNFLPSGTEQP